MPKDSLVTQSTIKETFLPCSNSIDDVNIDNLSICVRERSKNGSKIYHYEKRYILGNERIQELRIISAKDYIEFVRQSDKSVPVLQKIRTKFFVETQPFVLETVLSLPGKPTFLRVETAN